MILLRLTKTERTSGFTIRSTYRWRNRVSTSVSPCHFSGKGSRFLDRWKTRVAEIVSSSGARAEDGSFRPDDIAEIEQLKQLEIFRPDEIPAHIHLEPVLAVGKVHESGFPVRTQRNDAAADAHEFFSLLEFGTADRRSNFALSWPMVCVYSNLCGYGS